MEDEGKEWKNSQRKMYDENIAYRLCYNLRNFVQHVGLPIQRVSERKVRTQVIIEYFLNGEQMVADKQLVRKLNVKTDFFKNDETLSFMQYANNYAVLGNVLYIEALRKFIEEKVSFIEDKKKYLKSHGFLKVK